MANSGTVTAGSAALASQYNNLRDDVLNVSTGHTHTGASEDGKKVEGSAIASTGATNGQVLAADGAGGAAFTTLAGAGALSGTVVDLVWAAATATQVTYAAGAQATWSVSGGGTQIYQTSPLTGTTNTTIRRHVLGAAATAASTTVARAVAGTAENIIAGGYGFNAGTAMVYVEHTQTTSTNHNITLRKFNDSLTTNMWNATIWTGKQLNRYQVYPFVQSAINYEPSIGIWYSWDRFTTAEAGTSLVYVVNDASGSVYTAPFFVSSATEDGGPSFCIYVPPSGAGNGTIYAWGTTETATGSTVTYRRIAYEVGSASITAASTVTSNYGFPALQEANGVQGGGEIPSRGWYDAANTAIVLTTTSGFTAGNSNAKNNMVGLDRTAGTLLFRSVQHSGTVLRIDDGYALANVFDPVRRMTFNLGNSAHALYKLGDAGEFYQPRNFAFRSTLTGSSNNGWMGFAGAGSAEYSLTNNASGGSTIYSTEFDNNLIDVQLLAASDKGRLVFHDVNLSDRWRPVTLSAGSAFPVSSFVGSINNYLAAATGLAGYTGGDFPLYLPANTTLTATFSRAVIANGASEAANQPAGTAKFALKVIQLA
jgi:hypothetical protein